MNVVVVKIYSCKVGSLDRLDFEEVTHMEWVIFENSSKDKMFIQLSTSYFWFLFYWKLLLGIFQNNLCVIMMIPVHFSNISIKKSQQLSVSR